MGGIPAGPGDQRPGHRRGHGDGQERNRHGRAIQGGAVGGSAGADETGEPKLRAADETVAFGERDGDGLP